MLKPNILSHGICVLDSFSLLQSTLCLRCHIYAPSPSRFRRNAGTSAAQKASIAPSTTNAALNPTQTPPKAPVRPTSSQNEADHTPLPLSRPIGMTFPPRPGENTGIDTRSFRERRADFVNYEKHIEKREKMTRQFAKPYFRDWKLLRHHEGKTFLCPPRLFKSSHSLYVPNLHGVTLASPRKPVDTTPLILNRISVVAIWSSLWGENQAATFVSRKANPGLHELLAGRGKDIAQVVRINVETNWLKALLIRIFMWSLRRKMESDDWGRWFLLRKGLNDEIRGAIAAPNLNVGYVYLVDWDGRIRWAACGNAADGETDALNSGLGRLLEQWKLRKGGVDVLKGAVPVSAANEAPTKFSFPKQTISI